MDNIGKYEIEVKIGSGGFGDVFKGYDPFIKRHVAVKTCRSDDTEIRERFFQEAEIAGKLQHRNITTVYDFGIQDGLPYLIQEYLSGEDLDAKIKRRDFLPYPEKLYYLLQIARGLGHAHTKGVIHRDIKPANIRILEEGTAKIMDFGIAKLALQESGLTQTGMTLGTAAYLAPEQVRGDSVDLRTDIFSFGVLAYELLTYERPFQGEQISAVLYQLLNHEPKPLNFLWPAAPNDLVTVVDRCLHKEASERFADGNELVRDLEGLQKRGRLAPTAKALLSPPPPLTPPAQAIPVTKPIAAVETALIPDVGRAGQGGETKSMPTAPGGSGSTVPHLSDISYDRHTGDHPTQSTGQASFAAQASSSRRIPTLLGLVLVILFGGAAAATLGWWLGQRDPSTDGPVPQAAAGQDASMGTTLAELQQGSAREDSLLQDSGAPAEESAPASAEPESPADNKTTDPVDAEEPQAPALGRVIVPAAGWTDDMTVTIKGQSYGLQVRRFIDLPVGAYRAVFELKSEEYDPGKRVANVVVKAEQTQTLTIPIPRPATLTARPLPGRPQGEVFIDGKLIGPTPLPKLQRLPGTYALEIRPQGEEGEGLTETLRLDSGQETILSFDLVAGSLTSRVKNSP